MKPLTIEEIEEARKRTAATATRLIDAAETMLEAGHPPLAFFLAHTAVEEIAKIPMLVGVGHDIIVGRTIDWKEVGKRLESHPEKIQQTWIGLHINANEKISDPALLAKARKWFSPDGDAKVLREHALYTGVVNRPGEPMAYKSPDEVISRAMAAEAVVIAKLVVTKRVQEEELSRGRLAQTPRGLVEMFERHIDAVLEARQKPEGTGC